MSRLLTTQLTPHADYKTSMSNETKIKIAEEVGLVYNGMIEGEPQFIGTDKQFEAYEEELAIAEEEALEAEESKDQSYGEAIGSR